MLVPITDQVTHNIDVPISNCTRIKACVEWKVGWSHRSAAGQKGKGFGKSEAAEGSGVRVQQRDKKWELKAAEVDEWKAWVESQKEAADVKGDDVYVQVWTCSSAVVWCQIFWRGRIASYRLWAAIETATSCSTD
jgi:hypothetical protein